MLNKASQSRSPPPRRARRSPAPAHQVSHRALALLMQKSARAIYRLPPIFSQAPAVENFKFPARFFKFHFKNPARFFKSRGRGRRSFFCSPSLTKKIASGQRQPGPVARRFFSISASKFPPRFFPARRTCFHKVVSKIRLRFFKFRFQISQRFFKSRIQVSHKSPAKSRFRGNWANLNLAPFTPNPHGACHAVSRSRAFPGRQPCHGL